MIAWSQKILSLQQCSAYLSSQRHEVGICRRYPQKVWMYACLHVVGKNSYQLRHPKNMTGLDRQAYLP